VGARMATRGALLALALMMAAWFALGIRQAQDTNRASALVSPGARLTASQARKASDLLDAAGFLNPDRQVEVLRAELRADQGDLSGARSILKGVVRTEPQNLAAWLALARSSAGDVTDFYAAAYAIHHLVPPVPPAP
jgi:predicted Zn-dependent protease